MSDYSETFTKVDGNTIEAADFETEFQAIETAIATKLDVDSDTATNLTIGTGFGGGVIGTGSVIDVSTSATSYELSTSIPSWAKKVIISYSGVNTSGTDEFALELGNAGGYVTSGYVSGVTMTTSIASFEATTGDFTINRSDPGASSVYTGHSILTLLNSTTDLWVCSSQVYDADANSISFQCGHVALSGTLTKIKLQTKFGVDTFEGGSVSIMWGG